MGFKSGSPVFGEFDFDQELRKLCEQPAYAHVFESKGIPTLAVYRSNKNAYRGFARPATNHIHLSIGRCCTLGQAQTLIAHELAHIICDHLGYDGEDRRCRWHHFQFDKVMQKLIQERHGILYAIGDRNGRYDYTWRLAKHLEQTLENGETYLRSVEALEQAKNIKRDYEKVRPTVLWGWKFVGNAAQLNLRTNQVQAVKNIMGNHRDKMVRSNLPMAVLQGNVLQVPLVTDSLVDFVGELDCKWHFSAPLDKAAEALSNRIAVMYQYVCKERQRALSIAAGESK